MNKQTRNAIATAIAPHTGHGRVMEDYWKIIDNVRRFGFDITDKVADEYSQDMTHKHNAYILVDLRTGKELDSLLVIDEYFPNNKRTDAGHPIRWEITAYIS